MTMIYDHPLIWIVYPTFDHGTSGKSLIKSMMKQFVEWHLFCEFDTLKAIYQL